MYQMYVFECIITSFALIG